MIEIRELDKLEDFQQCVQIQKEVWGFDDPYDIVPLPLLIVSKRNDGIVLGAFDGEKMVGFVYSLPGKHEGAKVQWSHMLAVIPEYRNSDIGHQLKMAQYRESREKDYEAIEWTYDPLESRNAYFNLKKLGCIACEYEINIYGETSSPLHAGMPTDRLIAHWPIPPLNKTLPEINDLPQEQSLITQIRYEEKFPFIQEVDLSLKQPFLFLEIPPDIQQLKTRFLQEAIQWRMKTREAFLHYFNQSYIAYSFYVWKGQGVQRSFYLLKKMS